MEYIFPDISYFVSNYPQMNHEIMTPTSLGNNIHVLWLIIKVQPITTGTVSISLAYLHLHLKAYTWL